MRHLAPASKPEVNLNPDAAASSSPRRKANAGCLLPFMGRCLPRFPSKNISIRISHSGCKAQYQGDTRNCSE